jgi:alcohol dehydrogenase
MLGGDDLAAPVPMDHAQLDHRARAVDVPAHSQCRHHPVLASGTLDLAPERVRSFGRDAVNDAITYAAAHGGPFDRTSLTPSAG